MSSLLDLLSSELSQSTVQQVISSQLGTDPATTQKAIGAALPMLMGALGRNATTNDGAQALSSALRRDHDGSILNDLAGSLGNQSVLNDGQAILGHVLGGKRGTIEGALGSATGMDTNQVGQLLAMLAPVVLGQLGKTQQQGGLDANALAGLLGGERQAAESQLGGFASLLDMDGDGSIVDDVMNIGTQVLGGLFGGRKQ